MDDDVREEIGNDALADWLEQCADDMPAQGRIESLLGYFHTEEEAKDRDLNSEWTIVSNFFKQHRVVTLVGMLSLVLVGAGTIALRGLAAVREATEVRERLDSLYEASGLESSFEADFGAVQPNVIAVAATIDPALVASAAVTYDNGETWRTLYTGSHPAAAGPTDVSARMTRHHVMTVRDEHAFAAPGAGSKRTVKALVRAKFIPEVIAAFPEYGTPEYTDRVAQFELSPDGINKLVIRNQGEPEPEVLLGRVKLEARRWEMVNSSGATADLETDPSDGSLVQAFELEAAGEYTNISHAIPGASPSHPAASLENLTVIEIELTWSGDRPITLEPKLVDDHGKIVGVMRFIEPGPTSQTLRVPARLLKGYFGVRSFDFSRVRRLELAVARKSLGQAAGGTLAIHRIDLLGTGEPLLEPPPRDRMTTLAALPTKPGAWSTAHSRQADIKLSSEGPLLSCEVSLPFDKDRDEELPWTNLQTSMEEQDFGGLQAIQLELKWDGAAPITIEPKLVTSANGDTYGTQRRIKPGDDFQTVLVYPQDLKFYWSQSPVTDATKLNLNELTTFSLGIARKAENQAERGTLYVKAVRLLGANN